MPLTVIRASAGSGKTYQLAVSFLKLLLKSEAEGQPLDPSQLLATTFTRAAAGEILDRILQLLSKAVLSKEECEALAISTELELSREICGRVLAHIARKLDRIAVSTMDSFFGQIAKAFSTELGMAPGWQMAVDEAEADLQHAAIEVLLQKSKSSSFADALKTYKKQQVGSSVQRTMDDLSRAFQKPGLPKVNLDAFHVPEPRRWSATEAASAITLIETCETWAPKTKAGVVNAHWLKALDKILEALSPGQNVTRLLNTTIASCVLEEKEYQRQPIPPCLCKALSPLIDIARDEIRRQHRARMEAFAWLAQAYRKARLSAIFQHAAYSFGDVTETVGTQAIYNDQLYFRLGSKFQHVLFDEFQDTSRQQYEFFRPLLEELGANGDSSIFVVGDEKQAIYGWRGGDQELMRGPLHELGTRIGEKSAQPLNKSYRSSPAVLHAVNRTFQVLEKEWIPDNPVLQLAGRKWGEAFSVHAPAERVQHLQGQVRLIEATSEDDEDKDAGIIATAVNLVCEHLRKDPQRKIAVLLRKNKNMSRMIAEIHRACPDVDVSGEGGNPLTDSRAVELLLSLLTYLEHPGHTAARYHVLSSAVRNVFGFPDSILPDNSPGPEEWRVLNGIRSALATEGYAGIIHTWIRAPAFESQCNEYDILRCEQLLDLAREADQRHIERLSRFVEMIRSRRMERRGGSHIRVMTIHASKGLEFETVVLLELDSPQNRGGNPSVMKHDGEWQIVPSKQQADLLGLKALYEKKVGEEFMGDLSVLYVGMTRARSFLDIILKKDSTTPLSGLLRAGLTPNPDNVVERFAGLTWREIDNIGKASAILLSDPGIAKDSISISDIPFPTRYRRTSYATPSSQEEEGTVSVQSILAPANRTAMKRGELVHVLLSGISWIEDGLPSSSQMLINAGVDWERFSRNEAEEIATGLLIEIEKHGTPLNAIFNRSLYAAKTGTAQRDLLLWRERRFALVDNTSGSAELLTGSFDRVLLWKGRSGEIERGWIIDFKTDRFSNEAEREALEARYKPQLDAYVRALRGLIPSLKKSDVQASLCFVRGSLE